MDWSLLLIGCLVTALSTGIGALPVIFLHRASDKVRDSLMGFSAGIMLAASSFSLIIPALTLGTETLGSKSSAAIYVGICFLVGGIFLDLCNRFIPHEHFVSGPEGKVSSHQLKRIWLFVFAITLHNFPEGLAVGSGTGSHEISLAAPILFGIGLQDIPEGFIVAFALVGIGYSRWQAMFVAFVTGLVEAAAAVIGFFATSMVQTLLPWSLAFAGGAMIYVVSNEIIPESHRKPHAHLATQGLMFGFVLMMILDVTLG
ncbi:ZIP family metal transporter [Pseudobdellovibrio exovorus]|uniref:GufA protein n=1 Tax=Pseudobdellovibrio exovorus JSS TaxID=1184267 RepID=M4V7C7_9BACT|nr:ZIP family metal transporter [Pseudobdellovibrio exovorus]AGH94340.1 hypothetical protein A11Q_120 [Pseudobdellovibrio exovorus JSS]